MYEPYEDLIARAELIVTGTVIEKQFVEEKPDVHTVYKLKIKEIIKGKSESIEIDIKASGGCLKSGVCISSGNSYEFKKGQQVFMMLMRNLGDYNYRSVRSGSTVSYVSDDGVLYSNTDDFNYNLNRQEQRSFGERPVTTAQVKSIVKEQR